MKNNLFTSPNLPILEVKAYEECIVKCIVRDLYDFKTFVSTSIY